MRQPRNSVTEVAVTRNAADRSARPILSSVTRIDRPSIGYMRLYFFVLLELSAPRFAPCESLLHFGARTPRQLPLELHTGHFLNRSAVLPDPAVLFFVRSLSWRTSRSREHRVAVRKRERYAVLSPRDVRLPELRADLRRCVK